MPIKFRCAYCSQLMGIGRRKAGAVVSCPTCHGKVVVPTLAAPSVEAPPAPGTDAPRLATAFEGRDFDPGLFQNKAAAAEIGEYDAQPVALPSPLTEPTALPAAPPPSRKRVLLFVGVLVLLGIGFGAGYAIAKLLN